MKRSARLKMSHPLDPSLFPWFAPLPGPMISHLCVRLERSKRATSTTALPTLFELVCKLRTATYFYMDPSIQARLQGGPAAISFSSGWLLKTIGAQAPGNNKAPISAKTLWYWRSKGLLKYQRYGLPDFSSAAALILARLIDHVAERNFLPMSMTQEEQDWWCFTQADPLAPVQSARASHLEDLPGTTLCWTPWMGAVWEPGWIRRRDQKLALRWSHLVRADPLTYQLEPAELLRWDEGYAALECHDPDVLQAAARLLLHRLGVPRATQLSALAFEHAITLLSSNETRSVYHEGTA